MNNYLDLILPNDFKTYIDEHLYELNKDETINLASKCYELGVANEKISIKEEHLKNALRVLYHLQEMYEIMPPDLFFKINYELILVYIDKNDEKEVRNTYKIVRDYYRFFDDDYKKKCAYGFSCVAFKYMEYLYSIKDYKGCLFPFDEIFDGLIKNTKDESMNLLANAFALVSHIGFIYNFKEKALSYMKNALSLVEVLSDRFKDKYSQIVLFTFNSGNICLQMDDYDNAIKYFIQAKDVCKNNKFDDSNDMFAMSSNYMAQALVLKKEYEEAINEYKNAIEYLNKNELDENKRNKNIKDFLNRIGIIYEKYLNNEEQSKIYYEKAEKVLLLMEK